MGLNGQTLLPSNSLKTDIFSAVMAVFIIIKRIIKTIYIYIYFFVSFFYTKCHETNSYGMRLIELRRFMSILCFFFLTFYATRVAGGRHVGVGQRT